MNFQCAEVESLYKRDDKIKKEDVTILQEWLKKQPHLPQNITEGQIIGFLHSCYYRIEFAKTTIDKYFTKRTNHPDLFFTLSKEEIRKAFSFVCFNILPRQTPRDYVVFLLKLKDYNVENFNFYNFVSLIEMMLTLYFCQYGYARGGVCVFDATGFTFAHLTKFNLSVLKHALDHVQEGAPLRLKGIHFINIVPVLDKAISLVKPFMKAEIFNLLQLHSDIETFYKYVPQDCMPEDYGGKSPSCQVLSDETVQNLIKNYDFFAWHRAQQVDESKRISNKSNGDVYGTAGTFKKLQLD